MFPISFKFVIVIISNCSVLACHQELTFGGSANHQGRGGGAKLVSFYESESSLAFLYSLAWSRFLEAHAHI